jgi:hypothetical protein
MGGKREHMVIKPLDDDEGVDLMRSFGRFDAAKAQCFLESDRQKVLSIIESAFGCCAPFNKIVRGIFRKSALDFVLKEARKR